MLNSTISVLLKVSSIKKPTQLLKWENCYEKEVSFYTYTTNVCVISRTFYDNYHELKKIITHTILQFQ